MNFNVFLALDVSAKYHSYGRGDEPPYSLPKLEHSREWVCASRVRRRKNNVLPQRKEQVQGRAHREPETHLSLRGHRTRVAASVSSSESPAVDFVQTGRGRLDSPYGFEQMSHVRPTVADKP